MLPSRGLRPAQYAPLASRQSTILRSNASRKFSSLPRTAGLSAPSCRTSPLQSARWRTGAAGSPNVVLTASSVRYGSWYAPWSWGKSGSPGDASTMTTSEHVPIAEFSHRPMTEFAKQHAEPAVDTAASTVTTATPEIAPAGIDKAAVADGASLPAESAAESASSLTDSKTLDDLFGADPVKDAPLPKPEFDPTQLIDHTGQLKELGLDYGFGITTTIERLLEVIYLNSGWGWAGTIIASCFVIRGSTFVLQAMSSDKMAAMEALKPVTQPIQEKMDAALAAGDKQKADLYKMQQAEVMKPYVGGIAATGGFMVVQAAVGFSAFRLFRAMASLPVPGMNSDGFLWFKDLALPDPYYILPVTTSAIMYIVFKTGGETGIQNDMGQAVFRQRMFKVMAVFLGLITSWQAAAMQIYFLTSGIIGGFTGWLLRQNRFRRFIGIRPIPTRKATELYSKVIKGEANLEEIKAPSTKLKYQAPTPVKLGRSVKKSSSQLSNRRQISGINIAPGASIPLHLKVDAAPVKTTKERNDRDFDYEEGAEGKPLKEKLDYYRRNYRLGYMYKRLKGGAEDSLRKLGYGGKKVSPAEAKRKRKAEEYEAERRRRFVNRE